MEITGTIDMFGVPIFQCDVANAETMMKTTVNTVIDTGAYHFHLKQFYIDALKLPVVSTSEIHHPTEGIVNTYEYSGVLDFEFGRCSIIIKPIILQSYGYDFIIGTSFLDKKHFLYDSIAGVWKIDWEA